MQGISALHAISQNNNNNKTNHLIIDINFLKYQCVSIMLKIINKCEFYIIFQIFTKYLLHFYYRYLYNKSFQ